jgi:hypothetical protein
MVAREMYTHLPANPPDLENRLKRLPGPLRRTPIQLAYLFCSCVRSPGQATDVDLAIVLAPRCDLRAFYADRPDLLRTDCLGLVELPQAPLWLRLQFLTSCLPIRERELGASVRRERSVGVSQHDMKASQNRLADEKTVSVDQPLSQHALADLRVISQELEKYRNVSFQQVAADVSLRSTVQRGLLAALTVILQTADHILTRNFGPHSDTYEDLLRERHALGMVSASISLCCPSRLRQFPEHPGPLRRDCRPTTRCRCCGQSSGWVPQVCRGG